MYRERASVRSQTHSDTHAAIWIQKTKCEGRWRWREEVTEEEGDEQRNYDTKYNLIINDIHSMFNFKYFYYFIISLLLLSWLAAAHILIRCDSFSLHLAIPPCPSVRLRASAVRMHSFVHYYKLHKYYDFDEVLKWLVGAEKCINIFLFL